MSDPKKREAAYNKVVDSKYIPGGEYVEKVRPWLMLCRVLSLWAMSRIEKQRVIVCLAQGWVEETEGGGLDVGGILRKIFQKDSKKK